MSKARNMARMGVDTSAGYTGAFDMPAGTTAQRPASAGLGWTRLNTDTGSVEVFDGTNWNSVTRPFISSVTGTIYAGAASNLVVAGQNFTSTITVRFLEGGSTVADVSGVTVTAGSATVAVPAAVYGQTAGDTIDVQVINSDGTTSTNTIQETVQALPTGGTVTTSGSYRIHTFTSSSSFVIPSGLSLSNVEYLVIAGGGGGATNRGSGGGGAGGYRCSVVGESSGGGSSAESRLNLSADTYTVTVGAGGAGQVFNATGLASNGSNSVFGTITSTGGGAGRSNIVSTAPYNGSSGGSGGGGGAAIGSGGSGGAGTSGQGYAGGNTSGDATTGDQEAGTGGGGAGGGGGSTTTRTQAGNGGSGVSSSITGTAVIRAGGGGGGKNGATSGAGTGGSGGGGNGVAGSGEQSTLFAGNGSANTGSGGGGGGANAANSGAGGSGIVIVRYQVA